MCILSVSPCPVVAAAMLAAAKAYRAACAAGGEVTELEVSTWEAVDVAWSAFWGTPNLPLEEQAHAKGGTWQRALEATA